MYIPKHNEETRVAAMHQLMQAQSFGTLITIGSKGLFASHIPMMLEQDGSEFGRLQMHVARANLQWRDFDDSVDALAIFAGHHHYVSASWYPKARETGAEVPTWNYVVVHAYGTLRAIEDPVWLLAHLATLTNTHEDKSGAATPWHIDDAPDGYIAQQMRGIVGFELRIRRLEGKWKVSQNRNEQDRSAVVQGLTTLDTPASLAMVQLVENAARPRK